MKLKLKLVNCETMKLKQNHKHTHKKVGSYTWGGLSCFSPLWHVPIVRGFVLCSSGAAAAISLQSTTDGEEENSALLLVNFWVLLSAICMAWEIKQPNERGSIFIYHFVKQNTHKIITHLFC